MTIHLFINQALVSASIYTQLKVGSSSSLNYDDIRTHVTFLTQLFRGEFIYATAGFAENLTHTLNSLEVDGVIEITRKPPLKPIPQDSHADAERAKGDTTAEDDTIDSITLSATERRSGRENFDFYCFLIWPFVEASWLGAVSLLMLTPPVATTTTKWHTPTRLNDLAQVLGKTLHAQGLVTYLEAVNKEVLKNAFARLEEDGILIASSTSTSRRGGGAKVLRLADEWVPERDPATGRVKAQGSRLWGLCESIARSRVEDGIESGGEERVLRLVEKVGKGFWEEGTSVGAAAVKGVQLEQTTEGREGEISGLKVVEQEERIRKQRSWGRLGGLLKARI